MNLVLALSLGLTAAFGAGCGATCDTGVDDNTPVRFTGGTTTEDGYETSAYGGVFLHFPGGQQYQLIHHLGFTPRSINVELAFGPTAQELAPCAGNACIEHCTDSEMIWVRNDTCSEFWIRVSSNGKSATDRGTVCTDGGSLDASVTGEAEASALTELEGGARDESTPSAEDAGAE